MRIITTLLAFHFAAAIATAQTVQFRNTSLTLISAEGVPMSPSERYRFALFLGPSTTVIAPGMTLPFDDPAFQQLDAYTTNSPLTIGAGRLQFQGGVVIAAARLEELGFLGHPFHLDFVVRGWSENAGTTWAEALANWNNGSPLMPMFIGTSTVGNDLMPSFGLQPEVVLFGLFQDQIPGFNMTLIPEPSALALAVLGGTALWTNVRRRKREPT